MTTDLVIVDESLDVNNQTFGRESNIDRIDLQN